jgi:ABC-2 type transport system permease protein
LIFFGLLGLYFLNLRNLRYHMMPPEWRNLMAFLNVFSVSSVLCSFGARFVFPQLSLEGHGFWIIGLAPTTMKRVLVAKFLVALVGMSVVSVGLMYVSTVMLQAGLATKMVAIGIAVAVSLAISGLSTGLGAIFIDLRQQNPSAIISGFGGTLNLVLSLIFMFAVIVPYGMVFHMQMAGRLDPAGFSQAMMAATGWVVVVTLAVTIIPLFLGAQSLARREY